jgi:hypothetical protein
LTDVISKKGGDTKAKTKIKGEQGVNKTPFIAANG